MLTSRPFFAAITLVMTTGFTNRLVQAQGIPANPEAGADSITVVQRSLSDQPGEISKASKTGLQVGFPQELILERPSENRLKESKRFVQGAIEAEIPLNLVLGRPKVLQLSAVPLRLYVPDDDVVRTEIIDQQSGREIALTGLKQGSTTMILWFADPESPTGQTTLSYLLRVYADPIMARPIESVEEELNFAFPNSSIRLSQIEDRLIVRGQTPDTAEMSQIIQVLMGARGFQPGTLVQGNAASEYAPVTLGQVANFQDGITNDELRDAASVRPEPLDPLLLARAGIINQLEVAGEQQVMLKVTVAEVNRGAARSIGLNFGVANSAGFTVFESIIGGSNGQANPANILASLDMGQVSLAIDALRRLNLSKTLAEPNLVTMNGQPAEFQAGGRFPVPVISAGGNGQNLQGVTFIPFGVSLEFTPTIRDRDIITLQLNAEVSTRDESIGSVIGGGGGGGGGGGQISGLNSRNFSTAVQLRSGQTIAVAGLLQTNYGASTDRVPFWGDLPIIGATGGINRSSSGEQELVILVTPHLVAPADSTGGYALPGDDVSEPTDIEFYVANRLESRRSKSFRSSVRTDHYRQKSGERCSHAQLMIGAVGPTHRMTPMPDKSQHQPLYPMQGEGAREEAPVIVAPPLKK
ncbi:MAG: type II and III secretion system protein family protein [Rubripirellula sp.]